MKRNILSIIYLIFCIQLFANNDPCANLSFLRPGATVFDFLVPEPVETFQQHYSGSTCYDYNTNVLTIESSGYLNMPNKPNTYAYFVWDVPATVSEIVIESNTIVNAAFHYKHGLKILGMDRRTSILYGTEIMDWNEPHACEWIYSSVWRKATNSTAKSEINNLTFYNPKVYSIRAEDAGNAETSIYNCNFIDQRYDLGVLDNSGFDYEHNQSNSDGVSAGPNSIVKNCYFETKDDNVKLNQVNLTVEDCTFNMVSNSVPFQLNVGNWNNGASMSASNIRIISNNDNIEKGRRPEGYPIISGTKWVDETQSYSYITIEIDGLYVDNPSATLLYLGSFNQKLLGYINNANLNISNYYWGHLHPDAYHWGHSTESSMTLCGNWPEIIVSCSTQNYTGSNVDSYQLPQFAANFIAANQGNNACPGCSNDNPGSFVVSPVNNASLCNGLGNGGGNCQTNLTLNTSDNVVSGTENQSASNQIEATNTIFADAIATYTAGNRVILKPGFKALFGSYFNAFIQACTSPKLAKPEENKVVKINNGFEIDVSSNLEKGFDEGLQINPNPMDNNASIMYHLKDKDKITLTLFDATGKHLTTLAENQPHAKGMHQLELDVNDLPTGIYYLKLQSKENQIIKKLMVAK